MKAAFQPATTMNAREFPDDIDDRARYSILRSNFLTISTIGPDIRPQDRISGPIVDIVRKFDPAVDVVISGHTHHAYVCKIDGRLVTSGDKFGTIVTSVDLKLDPVTRDVVSAKADNVIVRTGVYAKDPEQ